MDYYSMSDKAVMEALGGRFRALRLRNNLSQQQLAKSVQLSLNAIKALEQGKAKLATMIAVLRELGALGQLANFIPEQTVSPLLLAKQQGQVRQRARGARGKPHAEPEW